MPQILTFLVIGLSVARLASYECCGAPLQEQEAVPLKAEKNAVSEPASPHYLTASAFGIEGMPQQQYHFGVDYRNGALQRVNLAGTVGFVIKPTGQIDPQRRWVWIVPLWLALPSAHGDYVARYYVERLLEAGFHVAGFDVGTSLGSPRAAELFHQFHEHVVEDFDLHPKARMIAVSNGGLITYGYAFRYPLKIDRIFAIYPAIDFRSWPTFERVVGPGAITPKGLSYGLTPEQMTMQIREFNPIDNLEPLAQAHVPLLHIHGDADKLVPLDPNSTATVERYRAMGGAIELKVMAGSVHGGTEFFTDQAALEFLLAPLSTSSASFQTIQTKD